ncbi:hypothetical protein QR680_019306 [Steinernema hermaphroditum]|uniref:DUF7774 domain-containing protein n=1 Tax=Steinernema hermaphroditum TaxID=289476 RepID=A0AA39LAV6_9BILA|nr:hypothetical protein QR680_019306 [Steinernema hermaphroditum]
MTGHDAIEVSDKLDDNDTKKIGPTDDDLRMLRARFHNRVNRFANAINVETPFVSKDADGGIRVKVHTTQESTDTIRTQEDDDDDEFAMTVIEKVSGDLGGYQPVKTCLKTRHVIWPSKKKTKLASRIDQPQNAKKTSDALPKTKGEEHTSVTESGLPENQSHKKPRKKPEESTEVGSKVIRKKEKKEKTIDKPTSATGSSPAKSGAPLPTNPLPSKTASLPATKTVEKRKIARSPLLGSKPQKARGKLSAVLIPAPIPITPGGAVSEAGRAVSLSDGTTEGIDAAQYEAILDRLSERNYERPLSPVRSPVQPPSPSNVISSSSSDGGGIHRTLSAESLSAEAIQLSAAPKCEREKLFEQLEEDILLDNKVLQEIATDLNKGINTVNRAYIDDNMASQLMSVDKQKDAVDSIYIRMTNEPIEVDATAQKVVEALTSTNVLGQVLSTDESKLLSDYFNGLHPLDDKVVKVLETELEKILDRADQFYENKAELVCFMRNREKAKKHLLDAMISKKTGYLQNLWGNAHYYANVLCDGVAGVVDVANKGAVAARENAKVAMHYANQKASEAKELANRAHENIQYANQKAAESVVAAKETMHTAYEVANQQVNNAVALGQRARSTAETATIVARLVTADAAEIITAETARVRMTAEKAITAARQMTQEAISAVSTGYNKMWSAWNTLCSFARFNASNAIQAPESKDAPSKPPTDIAAVRKRDFAGGAVSDSESSDRKSDDQN